MSAVTGPRTPATSATTNKTPAHHSGLPEATRDAPETRVAGSPELDDGVDDEPNHEVDREQDKRSDNHGLFRLLSPSMVTVWVVPVVQQPSVQSAGSSVHPHRVSVSVVVVPRTAVAGAQQ
jgi:hypothetical protein